MLDGRLKAIIAFDPMQAVVPDLEEAQAIALRSKAAKNSSHADKTAVNIKATSGAAVAASAGGIPSGLISGGRGEAGESDTAVSAISSARWDKMVETKGGKLLGVDPPDRIEVEIVTQG